MDTTIRHYLLAATLFLGLIFAELAGANISGYFYLFLAVGFLAQLVDGMLGLGFGMVTTSSLMGFGIAPTAISSSVHSAEVFANIASGISHHANGNVDKKLFKALIIPGMIGAVLGAVALTRLAHLNMTLLRGIIATYTAILGLRLLVIGVKRLREKRQVNDKKDPAPQQGKVRRLAAVGGFLDSFGGGGWGPIVTTTLVHRGHTARYVIGTVNAAEFFISLASAASFLILLRSGAVSAALPLILGSIVAAPIAAKLTGKLASHTLLLLVAIAVICWSTYTFIKIL